MKFDLISSLILVIAFSCLGQALGDKPDPIEMARANDWYENNLAFRSGILPFSFTYDGVSSDKLLPLWEFDKSCITTTDKKELMIWKFTDKSTGLCVRVESIKYMDFPTVEWTVYLKNTGSKDTPVIKDLRGLDISVNRDGPNEFLLHHNAGSGVPVDYQPYETPLTPGVCKKYSGTGGRPMVVDMPYFNLEYDSGGLIVVVGWPGQWSAEFARGTRNALHIRAGQEETNFRLHPGEEVRTPLTVLQFWNGGDWIRAQNIWRSWMIAYNMPKPGGKPLTPILAAASSQQFGEMLNANEENQKLMIDRYAEEHINLDYWWMDIGWYFPPMLEGRWVAGTWAVDYKRFPNGLKAIDDHAKSKGMKGIVVWFEPEHVWPGTELYEEHADWLLKTSDDPSVLASINQGQPVGPRRLLNLGIDKARKWIANRFCTIIKEQGIDIYRQDFNIEPLIYWQHADTEDRHGITENKYITGYLKLWDELLNRNPNLLIDSCASGGRRNDIETLRRSVPMWRTDAAFDPRLTQCQMYGISQWIPMSGTGARDLDSYTFRSNISTIISLNDDVRRTDLDYNNFRKMISEWRSFSMNYFGDYYPLTTYSVDNNVWMAWQFNRSEIGEGVVQVFRRPDCESDSINLKLRGLEPDAAYLLNDLDVNAPYEVKGRKLMDDGLDVTIKTHPGAVIISYKKR